MIYRMRHWILNAIGGLVGALVAGVVAVNLVIYSGIEQGYESSLAEVFDDSPFLGSVVVIVLLAGPVLGLLTVSRLRRGRSSPPRAT